ncbi:MAG: DUF502 domain-containing protein [Zetaproteobacteria bacterium]|nr:MAG: DUF502 domain-containing protein [Zetaproteobacteria bacterium]
MSRLRRYLMAGVAALAPLLVTVVIINWLVDLSDRAVQMLPPEYRPEALLGFNIPGAGIIVALIVVVLVGAATSHFVGGTVLRLIDRIMGRIPLVRTVHKATRQLLDALLSDTSKAFREVVMVQFPQRGSWVMGFVTGKGRFPEEEGGDRYLAVFIPSTPIPTTGWLLFVRPDEVVHMDMGVEDGMKLVLSGGVLSMEDIRLQQDREGSDVR